MALRLSTAAVNALIDALTALVDGGPAAGTIQIRTGAQPATANDPATGTLLATITVADPSFAAGVLGVATLDATPALSTLAVAGGTAGWFRMADSTGATVCDGACALAGGQLNLDTLDIIIAATVTVTAGTATMPAG